MNFGMIMTKPKYGENAKLCYTDTGGFTGSCKNKWYL